MNEQERLAEEWRQLCLRRVRRFAVLANTPSVLLIPELRHLTRWSVLSAYRDCLQVGLGEEARKIIAEAGPRLPSAPAA